MNVVFAVGSYRPPATGRRSVRAATRDAGVIVTNGGAAAPVAPASPAPVAPAPAPTPIPPGLVAPARAGSAATASPLPSTATPAWRTRRRSMYVTPLQIRARR